MPDSILVVDDEEDVRELCADALRDSGYDVSVTNSARDALLQLAERYIDIVITDLTMPKMNGLELLREVRKNYPGVDVILMTGYGAVATAVEAMRAGAYDYITKPFAIDDLTAAVGRLAERRELLADNRLMRQRLQDGAGFGGLIGSSPQMQSVYRLIAKVAPRSQPVLITGESGTGKELAARAIHECGSRAREPFVPVDCGALSATLFESELFGHVPGAFTGASQRRQGLLASAGAGVLFLDEIGELPLELQAKLLRAIQEREFRPLGSNKHEPFHARIIAATNRDLEVEVREARFRGDLYYRLNVLPVRLPPLRERKADIGVLANFFLTRERQAEDPVRGISHEASVRLTAHSWPGNVRELRNVIERAMAVSDGPLLQPQDLDLRTNAREREESVPGGNYLEDLERHAIIEVLGAAGGRRAAAAKVLGISRTTLYKKLKDFGMMTASGH